jgi:hypothetical protein
MLFIQTIISFLREKEYRNLLGTSTIVIIIGGFSYHYLEGWDYIDSFYFSVITLTTIGFGDFAPQTTGGKIFTMIYVLIGLGMILTFIQTVYSHYSDTKKRFK